MPLISKSQVIVDGVDPKLVWEIILNCKKHHVQKFKIFTKTKYRLRTHLKQELRYEFLNDTVFKHNIRGFDDIVYFDLKDTSFNYYDMDLYDSNLNNSNQYAGSYKFSNQLDSVGFHISKKYVVLENDTFLLRYKRIPIKIEIGIADSTVVKYKYQCNKDKRKASPDTANLVNKRVSLHTLLCCEKEKIMYHKDTSFTQIYTLRDGTWKLKAEITNIVSITKDYRLKVHTTKVLEKEKKDLFFTIYNKETSINYIETNIYYRRSGLIKRIKVLSKNGNSIDHFNESAYDRDYLKLKIIK